MSRRRLFLIAGLVALLLAGAGLWQWRAGEANGQSSYRRGVAALDAGDPRTARVELLNAIRANPLSVDVHFAQARALLALDMGADAQLAIERTRKLGGTPAETRAMMAQALLLQDDPAGALREASAADVPEDQAARADGVAGRAMMAMGRMAQAQAAFARALQRAPDNADAWVDLGRYRVAIGEQGGAIVAADRAVALAPRNVKALILRGELTRAQYGLSASLPWFERALAVNPDSVPALTQYAATLADAGQAARMLGVTRRLLALEPGNPRAYLMQAVMAARAGDGTLARTLLDRTTGRLDGEPATMLLRGVLQLENGNAVLAAESLDRLVRLQPDNRTARTLLARAYYAMGDFPKGADALAPMVTQQDASPYVLTLAARVQEAMGNRVLAGDMLTRAAWPVRASSDTLPSVDDAALASGPPPASAATAADNIPYIRALLRTGRIDEALARATLLARANPGAPAAQIALGDTLDAAGQPMDAAHAYEAAGTIRFDRDAALRLTAAWLRAGNPARAMQVVHLFLSQNPGDVDARRLAGAAAMQAQDWRTAIRMLQAVRRQTGGHDAMLMADLARATLETGDAKQAHAYAAYAYRLMPANPMTADIYGYTLLRTGVAGQAAVDLLEKAVVLAPGHPVLAMHLGQAYAAIGRKSEAHAMLKRAVAADGYPERKQAVDALAAL